MRMRIGKWLIGLMLAGATTASLAQVAGLTDTKMVIGQTVGLTGIVAGPVKEFNEGVAAYLAEVNSRGGIHGRKIEMIMLDDKFDPALTLKNAEQLVTKDGVFMLFGGRGTPHTTRILPLLTEHGIPLLAPTTGAKIFHDPMHPMVFNVKAKYQDEVAKAVEHFSTVGVKTISLLYVDDSFGKDGLEGFTQAMAARQLKPVAITSFGRVNPDFDATAREVIKPNPGALIIVSSAKNTAGVIKAIRAQGGRMQIMTLSNNSSDSFLKDLGSAGTGVLVSQITPAPHMISTRLGGEFKDLVTKHGVTASYAAMEGFVNAKVLVEGLRRAGRNLTREGFVRAMESMRRVDFGGIMVTYGPDDHSGSEFVELTMIGNNGRIIR